jgi:hypothetical protein
MKTIRRIVIAAFSAAFLVAASQAAPSNWPPGPYKKITKKEQADDCCEAGGKVALACPDCKTLNEQKDKKGAGSFFDKNATHDCAGCKGKITVKPSAGGRKQDIEYSHECSKCKTGGFTCATHTKGAK